MRKPRWLLALTVFVVPLQVAANDMCVNWRCSRPYESVDVPSVDPIGAREAAATSKGGVPGQWSCSCIKYAHFVQAPEISAAVAADIKAAIVEGTRLATAEALTKIQQDNAKREEEMYKRLAEVVQKTDAQIKLLTELLRASTGAQTEEAGAKPPPAKTQPSPSSNK